MTKLMILASNILFFLELIKIVVSPTKATNHRHAVTPLSGADQMACQIRADLRGSIKEPQKSPSKKVYRS